MILKEIIDFLDSEIPEELALKNDKVGLTEEYDLTQEITSIRIYMDLLPEDDKFDSNTLIITHHPPLFKPKTPTYTIHSNWDIIKGGANEALAEKLSLKVISVFDENTDIGRICESEYDFNKLEETILKNFKNVRIVNKPKDNIKLDKIGIISGFGLKNPEYIKLASQKKLDLLISGDLTQETAILAKNLNIIIIDLGHHESEVPGLYGLEKIIKKINIDCIVINKIPIERLE